MTIKGLKKRMAKTWQEKYDNGRQPVVELVEKKFTNIRVGERMLISTPQEIDHYIRIIPMGTTRSVEKLRSDLAVLHHADKTCPLTTGIFLRIVAERAMDQLSHNVPLTEITPFWRVIEPTSKLAQKLSCGPEFITNLRQQQALV